MSEPAQKLAVPAPVQTIAAAPSRFAVSMASRSAIRVASSSALRRSGRLTVIVRTLPAVVIEEGVGHQVLPATWSRRSIHRLAFHSTCSSPPGSSSSIGEADAEALLDAARELLLHLCRRAGSDAVAQHAQAGALLAGGPRLEHDLVVADRRECEHDVVDGRRPDVDPLDLPHVVHAADARHLEPAERPAAGAVPRLVVDRPVAHPAADDRRVVAVEDRDDDLADLAVGDVPAGRRVDHLGQHVGIDVVQHPGPLGRADAPLAREGVVVAGLRRAVPVVHRGVPGVLQAQQPLEAGTLAARHDGAQPGGGSPSSTAPRRPRYAVIPISPGGREAAQHLNLAVGVVVADREHAEPVRLRAMELQAAAAEHGQRHRQRQVVARVQAGPAVAVGVDAAHALHLARRLEMHLLATARGAAGGGQQPPAGRREALLVPAPVRRRGLLVAQEVRLRHVRDARGELLERGDRVDVGAVRRPQLAVEGVRRLHAGQQLAHRSQLVRADLVDRGALEALLQIPRLVVCGSRVQTGSPSLRSPGGRARTIVR